MTPRPQNPGSRREARLARPRMAAALLPYLLRRQFWYGDELVLFSHNTPGVSH